MAVIKIYIYALLKRLIILITMWRGRIFPGSLTYIFHWPQRITSLSSKFDNTLIFIIQLLCSSPSTGHWRKGLTIPLHDHRKPYDKVRFQSLMKSTHWNLIELERRTFRLRTQQPVSTLVNNCGRLVLVRLMLAKFQEKQKTAKVRIGVRYFLLNHDFAESKKSNLSRMFSIKKHTI